MIKVCQYKSGPGQGERLVHLYEPGDIDGAARFFSMYKYAAPLLPEVERCLRSIKKNPTKIYVLVNALGASEYWGSNINGDAFPEAALVHDGPDYGHKTFLNAYPYMHHVNKDPSRSFGRVLVSVWHDLMKRVELIVEIDKELAKQFGAESIVDKLDKGIYPDVSMGTKVPYDLCSICTDWKAYKRAQSSFDPYVHKTVGHAVLSWHKRQPIRGLSVTRDDYCDHAKHHLNKILPDGRKVCVINDYPRFFDISFVFIGADKTAKVMAKLAAAGVHGDTIPSWFVAEQLGYSDGYKGRSQVGWHMEKAASAHSARQWLAKKAAQKRAEITKRVVPSQFGGKAVPPHPDHHPDLPDDVLDTLGSCPMEEALSTPSGMGIVLKPREFQRIVLIRIGKRPLADELDSAGVTFPPSPMMSSSIPMGSGFFNPLIMRMLLPFLENRSILEPVAKRRIIRITIMGSPEYDSEHEWSDEPLMQKLSAAYNGYLAAVPDCLPSALECSKEYPEFWTAVYGRGLASGFEKAASIDPILPGNLGVRLLQSQLALF